MKNKKWIFKFMVMPLMVFSAYNACAQNIPDEWERIDVNISKDQRSLHQTEVEAALAFFVKKNVVLSDEDEAGWLKTMVLIQIPDDRLDQFKGKQETDNGQVYDVSEVSLTMPIFFECQKKLKRHGPITRYSKRYGMGEAMGSTQFSPYPSDFRDDDPIETALIKKVCAH